MRIKTRHLQLLSQLERDGSVLRAAASLGMSQSAASRLLSDLENDVGEVLFERRARGVVPTPYGEIYVRRAGAALAEIAQAQVEVEDLRRGLRVPVYVGSLLSPCSSYLPAALLQLVRSAPDILVNVHVDTSHALIEGLMKARFDLVLARVRDASLEPELVFEPLVAEPFCIVGRAGHPLARRRRTKLKLADLVDQPWILPPMGADLRTRLDALCVQHGLSRLRSVIETVSTPIMLNLLRMSDALVVLPEDFVRPYCQDGSLARLPIDLRVRSERFGLITRRHRTQSPQLQRTLEVFRATARVSYPGIED